jgi:RNA polymerase sigma-70 factor (ECF subfamily)
MTEKTEKEILDLLKKKDSRNYGFNLLVRTYQKQVYWHVRRMVIDHEDANDVVQNTFLKIWKNIDRFREDSKLYTWIYRIATNETISFLNKKRSFLFVPIVNVENKLSETLKEDPYFKGDEIQYKLQQAILKLPEKQRLVFNMKYFENLKYETISEILGTSVGALKASYHHAVKKIEDFISSD